MIFSDRICLLHVGANNLYENIVLFTNETLEVCKTKKSIRNETKTKASKFDSIVLPEKIDEKSGYHPSCYKCFSAVSAKKKIAARRRCKKFLYSILLKLISDRSFLRFTIPCLFYITVNFGDDSDPVMNSIRPSPVIDSN